MYAQGVASEIWTRKNECLTTQILVRETMTQMGFKSKIVNALFWLYMDSSAQCILGNHLFEPWTLGRSIRQGCPLSALLYAITTHPPLLHLILLGKYVGKILGSPFATALIQYWK